MDRETENLSIDHPAEPTSYELYRKLKAAGVVSSVVSSGELLIAVGQPVPDAPSTGPLENAGGLAECSDDLIDRIAL